MLVGVTLPYWAINFSDHAQGLGISIADIFLLLLGLTGITIASIADNQLYEFCNMYVFHVHDTTVALVSIKRMVIETLFSGTLGECSVANLLCLYFVLDYGSTRDIRTISVKIFGGTISFFFLRFYSLSYLHSLHPLGGPLGSMESWLVILGHFAARC